MVTCDTILFRTIKLKRLSLSCCCQCCNTSTLAQQCGTWWDLGWQNSANGGSQIHVLINSWWRHQMVAFSALLALCAWNSSVTGEFPSQRPVTRSFMFSLICTRINGSITIREAGDLRRYRDHYDVTVILTGCGRDRDQWARKDHLNQQIEGYSKSSRWYPLTGVSLVWSKTQKKRHNFCDKPLTS